MRFNEINPLGNTNFDPIVKKVQTLLSNLGYDLGPTGIDGILGPYTKKAYDKFMSDPRAASGKLKKVKKSSAPTMTHSGVGIIKPVNGRVSSKFGMRGHQHHKGVDIAVPVGTPVRAPEDCVVGKVGYNDPTAGNYIVLTNSQGQLAHRLLHLSKINVKQGQQVKQGDIIASSGATGHVTGPHLHWERYVAGVATDPMTA
jgi:murein DD-endopeptidase MepM/ murein hydrolase activator NlpD